MATRVVFFAVPRASSRLFAKNTPTLPTLCFEFLVDRFTGRTVLGLMFGDLVEPDVSTEKLSASVSCL